VVDHGREGVEALVQASATTSASTSIHSDRGRDITGARGRIAAGRLRDDTAKDPALHRVAFRTSVPKTLPCPDRAGHVWWACSIWKATASLPSPTITSAPSPARGRRWPQRSKNAAPVSGACRSDERLMNRRSQPGAQAAERAAASMRSGNRRPGGAPSALRPAAESSARHLRHLEQPDGQDRHRFRRHQRKGAAAALYGGLMSGPVAHSGAPPPASRGLGCAP